MAAANDPFNTNYDQPVAGQGYNLGQPATPWGQVQQATSAGAQQPQQAWQGPRWQLPNEQQMPAWMQQGYAQRGFGSATPYFTDPLTQPIMQSWSDRMGQLSQGGPNYGDIEGVLRSSMDEDPRIGGLIKNMTALANRKAPPNAYLGQYARSTQGRMKELNEDPFSGSDEAALKARFFDDLARTRDDRTQQLRERLAASGMAPTSGTAQEAGALLEGEYEGARASQQRDLLKYVTDERNRRRDLAVTMSGGLSQHGQADAQNQAQWMSQQANIGQGLAGLLANLQMNRGNVAQSLYGIRRQGYLDDLERGGMMLQTSAIPAEMQQQRMMQLQQLLAGQGTPQSIYEQQLAQTRAQDEARARADANTTALYGQIGQGVGNAVSGYYQSKNA